MQLTNVDLNHTEQCFDSKLSISSLMALYLLKMLEVQFDFELIWRVRRIESSWYLVYMLLLGNKTVISWLFGE